MKKVIHKNNANNYVILKGVIFIFLAAILFLKPIIQTVIHTSNDDIELSESGSEEVEVEILDAFFDENTESIQANLITLASYSRKKVYHFYPESIRFNFNLEIVTPPPELT